MPAVTRLERQKKRPDRINVFLDDAYALSLNLDLAATLRRGQVLSDADIAALKSEDGYRYALGRAMDHLARRPRSEAEVRRYLADKEFVPELIERVLARLADLKLVDDAAFAAWWAENRALNRPRGRQAVVAELRQRGVASEVASGAVNDLDDASLALDVALAQAARYAGLPRDVFTRRLGGYLARRGFGGEPAMRAVREAWGAVGGGGGTGGPPFRGGDEA